MVADFFFPFTDGKRSHIEITESVVQKIGRILFETPIKCRYGFAAEALTCCFVIKAAHAILPKFGDAILEGAQMLSCDSLPYVAIVIANSNRWIGLKIGSI